MIAHINHQLTHCGLVVPYGVKVLDQHWLTQWLGACLFGANPLSQRIPNYCQLYPQDHTSGNFNSVKPNFQEHVFLCKLLFSLNRPWCVHNYDRRQIQRNVWGYLAKNRAKDSTRIWLMQVLFGQHMISYIYGHHGKLIFSRVPGPYIYQVVSNHVIYRKCEIKFLNVDSVTEAKPQRCEKYPCEVWNRRYASK